MRKKLAVFSEKSETRPVSFHAFCCMNAYLILFLSVPIGSMVISTSSLSLIHIWNPTRQAGNIAIARFRGDAPWVLNQFFLFGPATVIIGLIIGGLFMIFAEKKRKYFKVRNVDPVSYTHLDVYKRQPLTVTRILPALWIMKGNWQLLLASVAAILRQKTL